jgi:hypothetical protein
VIWFFYCKSHFKWYLPNYICHGNLPSLIYLAQGFIRRLKPIKKLRTTMKANGSKLALVDNKIINYINIQNKWQISITNFWTYGIILEIMQNSSFKFIKLTLIQHTWAMDKTLVWRRLLRTNIFNQKGNFYPKLLAWKKVIFKSI